MVLIQLDLPEKVDKELQHFMINRNINKKTEAIILILERQFK